MVLFSIYDYTHASKLEYSLSPEAQVCCCRWLGFGLILCGALAALLLFFSLVPPGVACCLLTLLRRSFLLILL